MPSFAPSSASHCASTAVATTFMSSRENECCGIVRRLAEALDVPGMLERGLRQIEARVAREEAVELAREPRRADHRVPAAVRAADHVRVLGPAAVVALDDGLRERRERDVRRVAVVEARLLVEAEQIAADEARVAVRLAVVAGIGAQHRVAARERVVGLIAAEAAVRGDDRAVVAAVQLVEVAAVPVVRQPHLEADRVRLAVAAGALVDGAAQRAVRTGARVHLHGDRGHDSRLRQTELLEARRVAGHRWLSLRHRSRERGRTGQNGCERDAPASQPPKLPHPSSSPDDCRNVVACTRRGKPARQPCGRPRGLAHYL